MGYPDTSRIGVMQVTDTLVAAGAERVAVNLANMLPRDRYRMHLCSTRQEGPLAALVAEDVGRLRLGRTHRFELGALRRMAEYIQEHRIQVLHAHGSSLFISALITLRRPHPAMVWHDHFGLQDVRERSVLLHRVAASRAAAVIAVNQSLVQWSRTRLRVPADRVWYVPNFVDMSPPQQGHVELPGTRGKRIVCVANFREQKDHPTLIAAMALVVREVPDAQLLLVGARTEPAYVEVVQREIQRQRLERQVTWLGERQDVRAVLAACDIGVLSSASEGLPLALLEYGATGLPVVATRVGQCAEVLDEGRAGILVPRSEPAKLASALLELLRSEERRNAFGKQLRARIEATYSPPPLIARICDIYEGVANAPGEGVGYAVSRS